MKTLVASIVFASLVVALNVNVAIPSEEENDRAQILEGEIDSLRAVAKNDEALGAANKLLVLLTTDKRVLEYQIADAVRLVETLKYTVELPSDAQLELAQAFRMTEEYELLAEEGEYERAADLAEQQLEIRKKYLSYEHSEVATSFATLGSYFDELGNVERTESCYREALKIDRKVLGNKHPYVAYDINTLALFLHEQGDLTAAGPLYREALDIFIGLFGEENSDVAMVYSNLASLFKDKGDFASAEPIFRKTLLIYRQLYGAVDYDVAESLHNLATLLWEKGNYIEAEQLFREATGIFSELDEPLDLALSLNGLASVLQDRRYFAASESSYRESLKLLWDIIGGEHEYIAKTINNLGDLYHDMGDYTAADSLYKEALAMYEGLFKEERREVASILLNIARNYRDSGDYDAAEPVYQKALEMFRRLVGEGHPNNFRCLYSIGNLYAARGDYKRAEKLLSQAAEIYEAARLRAGSGLARVTFQESPYTKLANTKLALEKNKDAWPAVERDLGRVLADLLLVSGRRDLTHDEATREDSLKTAIGDVERELAVYRRAARVDTTGEGEKRVDTCRNRLLAFEAALKAFQQEIAAKHPLTEGQSYPLKRVQKTIPKKTALIGWLDVEVKKGEYVSWGYLVKRKGRVKWARVRSAEEEGAISLFKRNEAFRKTLARPVSSAMGVKRDAHSLWIERIQPLSDDLKDVEQLIIIPSGAMLGIPVEVLVDDRGEFVGEHFTVSYVPSATMHAWLREVAEEKGKRTSNRTLLCGDPPFSKAHLESMENTSESEATTRSSIEPQLEDSTINGALRGNEASLAALPRLLASREEILAISKIAPAPTVLLGEDASEVEVFRFVENKELRDFSTLHIATHAFVDDDYFERSALVFSQVDLPDPMESVVKGTRIYDGLVTVNEIINEWKLDADLVTLSACETGLGRVVGGEGYIGLSHAFLQVGARSLIVSLWKVEDRATSMLMQRFYENYFGQYEGKRYGRQNGPLTKAEALQEAKIWLRTYTNENGEKPFTHPFFWSAFILIGDRGTG